MIGRDRWTRDAAPWALRVPGELKGHPSNGGPALSITRHRGGTGNVCGPWSHLDATSVSSDLAAGLISSLSVSGDAPCKIPRDADGERGEARPGTSLCPPCRVLPVNSDTAVKLVEPVFRRIFAAFHPRREQQVESGIRW